MNRFYCFCYFLSLALASSAQRKPATSGLVEPGNKGVVTTLAENQHPDLNVDGPGAVARFAAPTGIAVDANGVLYVADRYNHTIRRISATGIVSTLAGQAGSQGDSDGPGPLARFNHPTGVAVDASGTVYVADRYNHTIRKISPAGVVSTLAGLAGIPGNANGTGRGASFNQPMGVAVDGAGIVYVADRLNRAIRRISPAGEATTLDRLTGSSGHTDISGTRARFDEPTAIAVAANGTLYLEHNASTQGICICQISPAGIIAVVGKSDFGIEVGEGGFAVDTTNRLFVVNDTYLLAKAKTVVVGKGKKAYEVIVHEQQKGLTRCKEYWRGESNDSDETACFKHPVALAVDKAGNLYVTDLENQNISRITPAGVVSVIAGRGFRYTGLGRPQTLPGRAAVNAAGTMYVADASKHVIYQVSPAGVASVFAGSSGQPGTSNGTGSAARFWNPSAVAVDAAGTVYVADAGNHAIRKISAAGVVTTLAGSGSVGNTNGPAATARFYWPTGVAVDAAGTVYVADRGNHVIRQISPAGVVSTLAGRVGVPGIADGTGTSARFNDPADVTVDATGAVFVTDRGRTIRVIR